MKRCITVIGAVALLISTAAAQDWPRYETSLQYTFTRFNPERTFSSFNANGGSGQFAYNFNRWFSGVIDLGAVHNGRVLDSTMANYLAGPRLSFHKGSRFTPYIQTLFGGVYATSSTEAPFEAIAQDAAVLPPGTTIRATRQETAFAMTAGGGLDIKMSKHVSFRPIQVEYFLTRLANLHGFNDNRQDNVRYSAGLNFTFGGEEPTPLPPTQPLKSCPDGSRVPPDTPCPKQNVKVSLSASPQELCQGETAQLNPSVTGADSNQLNFQWSVNGKAIGQQHSFTFGTVDRDPGTYTVALTVAGANFNAASAQTTITVREYRAPTGTAQASPAEIYLGEKATLTASCQGQCGGTIQPPTFEASEGSVQGDQFDSTGMTFDPSDNSEQRKTVTITAKCADSRNIGTTTTTITVIKKAVIVPVRLPDVLFDNNSARVNNCGKRILLEQLRAYFERDPSGKVVLVGHQSSDEKPANLSEQRVMNAAAVITAGTGVCLAIPQSQVLVSSPGVDQNGVSFEPGFCSSSVRGGASSTAEMRRVEVWFVPNGGQLPTSSPTYQDASYLSLGNLGCPK